MKRAHAPISAGEIRDSLFLLHFHPTFASTGIIHDVAHGCAILHNLRLVVSEISHSLKFKGIRDVHALRSPLRIIGSQEKQNPFLMTISR
jgi:hypothetical protein